jgi:pimeloyl-ACP methyl ester carboxylesterase
LFEHLGYPKYNLFGGSYGTRLARVVQDLFPAFVNSSVLDSPSPLSTDFLISRLDSYSLALERILAYCDNTPECQTEYPRLKEDYFKALKRLKRDPLEVRFSDSEVFWVNEQDGIYLLRRLLYMDGARERAPRLIRAFLDGNPEPVKEVLKYEYALTEGINMSMLLSVERYENFRPENTPAAIEEHYRQLPLLPLPMGFFDAFYRAGQGWHEAILPLSERSFRPSAIPTLIFANRYDPVTPPEYGNLFMETLSKGQLLILDESGHGAGNQDCKDRVMAAFMDDPEGALDTSCLNIFRE